MRRKSDFVTNSSSSSFMVIFEDEKDLDNLEFTVTVKLKDFIAWKIKNEEELEESELTTDFDDSVKDYIIQKFKQGKGVCEICASSERNFYGDNDLELFVYQQISNDQFVKDLVKKFPKLEIFEPWKM